MPKTTTNTPFNRDDIVSIASSVLLKKSEKIFFAIAENPQIPGVDEYKND